MQPASSSNIASGPSSSTSTEEWEAATNNSHRRKRRRMTTGHEVGQRAEVSRVSPPPIQQQERPTSLSIEERHVAGLAAEPSGTDRPAPAAHFVEVQAADEPMEIEAQPDSDEIPIEDLIANFLPRHQEEIRERLNDEDVQRILNEARNFLILLRESGIKLSSGRGRITTPTLFSRLKSLSVTKDADIIRKFFVKATLFFSAVNTAQTKNTGCLSTMLELNAHITNFVNETEDNLRLLAGNPYLKQITSMCNRRGVPDPVKAAEIIEWDCWKLDGTFCLELLRTFSSMMSGRGLINDQAQVVEMLAWGCLQLDGEFSMELLRAVSSMMSHRGFPDKDTLTTMLAWDCWKVDGKFSIELLRIFSSMMSGCGIPEKEKVEGVLSWPCWKVDGKFSFELLRTFSSMSRGRGLIKQAEVERVLAWPCWHVDGKFSFDLLRTFSSMSHGKGLIKQAEVERVLAWPCWQVNGKFSLDLLRIFSSMTSSRGLLKDEARIKAILAWDCWQVEGEFSTELLRTVASMLSSRGLPEKEPTENLLSWPCWQVDSKFSLDLLRIFSAMHHGRGYPADQEEIAAIQAWSCWRVNGKFSYELLRSFSSMMSGKGLFNRVKVEAILAWPCWQVDGKFNIELLRIFSSMMSGCGIPQKEKVEAILAWPCWQVDGKFSFDLLRTFSSMSHGRGLIKQAEVEGVLAWPCWQVDGKFSFDLLRTFSSMSHGRGLIKQTEVEGVLAWECWQVDGKFSFDLLRTFSSMSNGRGLIKQAEVERVLAWLCWQVDGTFSLDLLRIFSSMMSGQGLFDDEVQVQAILAWNCWKVDGKFNLPLLRTIASMMHGRGLLKKAPVEQLLSWPCWQVNGKFSLKLLQIFSVMMIARGLLKQTTLEAFMAWLPSDHMTRSKEETCLKVACQLFTKTGLPDPKILADIEATLRRYIPEEAIASDEEVSSDSEDEPEEMVQIKALTLFCAAPAKWRTSIAEIEQFLVAHNTTYHGQKVFRATLDSLLRILANHGQAGFQFWLKYYSDNPDRKHALTRALLLSAPLVHTKYALTQLPESQWPEYIELCKNLTPAPNKEQWWALKPLRELLHRRFTLTLRKRMMLEILWPQSEHNRLRYADKLDTLLKTVPTIYQMYRLHQTFKPQKLQAFLDACLARQNTVGQGHTEAVPRIKNQELLLEGLLLTNHYLSDHGQIPELCFSKQIAGTDGSGIIVDGDVEMSGHQRLWHFIAAMLIELKQTEYQFKRQQIKISPPDSEPVVLPKPKFACPNGGFFVITNWSPEQLSAFFRATEFTERWYKLPPDKRDLRRSRRLEEKLLQMQARATQTPQPGHKRASLLSPTVIATIIRRGDRLKEAVWSSLEHYAKNGQLSDELCRMLAPVIQQEPPGTVPEIVRTAVTAIVGQIDMKNMPVVEIPSRSSASPNVATSPAAAASPIPVTHATFDIAIQELERFHVLERDELEMLAPWRDQMTYTQLKNVIDKMNLNTADLEIGLAWQVAFESKAREHLDSNLVELLEASLEGVDD